MKELRAQFARGEISKQEYIHLMHERHNLLFDYMNLLKDTDIKQITITEEGVVATTNFLDIKMEMDGSDERIIPIEILNFTEFEREELNAMQRLIHANFHDDFVIFDIGGNIGYFSLALAKLFPDAAIHTFEPIPKTFAYLQKNLQLNDLKRVNAYNFGFSHKSDILTFYYYPECSGNASAVNLSGKNSVEEVKCQVKRLDDFVKENGLSIDFIKCDVEGAELFVFQGAQELLKTQRPIIFTEMLRKWATKFDYHPNDIIALFEKLGYKCYRIEGGKLHEFKKMDDQTTETNFFFLDPGKHKLI